MCIRDSTMIAFTGLTLCTGRRKDAEEILLTFSKYIRHGIVPNMNGFVAARAIRKVAKPDAQIIPIIALSADDTLEDVRKCKEARCV